MCTLKEDKIKEYSARNSKFIIGEQYKFGLDWRLFSHRILKNYFFKENKINAQKALCPICEENLVGKIHLHHIDYDHTCQRGENIKESKYNMPNCEQCFYDNQNYFNSCAEKTVIVHSRCHGKLHNDSKQKKNRRKSKTEENPFENIQKTIEDNENIIYSSPKGDSFQKKGKKTYNVEEIRKVLKNAYMPWTKDDDEKLKLLFCKDYTVKEIASILERNEGSIQSRIKKLELTSTGFRKIL